MGAKINNFSIGDSNIESLMLATDELFTGFHKVSLTNYDTTDESQVAAGSIVECAGALYKFSSNESITGSPSDGTVYIRIVPDTTTCTLEYTNTAPTWSDAYQGWYGTGGAATYRYLEFIFFKIGTDYFKDKLNTFGDFVSYMFLGNAAGTQSNPGSGTDIYFDNVIYDPYSSYNSGTHTLTLPLSNSLFLIYSEVFWSNTGQSDQVIINASGGFSSSGLGNSKAINSALGWRVGGGAAHCKFSTGTNVGTISTDSFILIKRIGGMP